MQNQPLTRDRIKRCIKKLSDNIRAENISYPSYLELYSGAENLENIDNKNNTVIYGRRGSGKTHLLRALQEKINGRFEEDRHLAVYLDLRRVIPLLPSDASDPELDALLIFKHVLQEVALQVADDAPLLLGLNEFDPVNALAIRARRERLEQLLQSLYLEYDGRSYSKPSRLEVTEEERRSLSADARLSTQPSLGVSGARELASKRSEQQQRYVSVLEVSGILEQIISAAELGRLFVLLDEWSEVSLETQLLLAELMKKNFSAIAVSVKIAAIPNRTNLGIKTDKKFIGLEDGGDILSYPLDLRYVFEVNKLQTRGFFNDLLRRHLRAIDGAAVDALLAADKRSEDNLINSFFANVALGEVLIACAGVPRDFMNLTINAYDKLLLTGNGARISVKHLRSANHEWYESDKKEQVDKHPVERQLLSAIVQEVIGKKKSIHFLVPEKYSQNKHILNLIDFRVMHLRRSGYSHKDHSGEGYNVYSIDYGCYNSLNISKNKLESLSFDSLAGKDLRDVRRISLEESFFAQFFMSVGEAFPCPHCRRPVDTSHLAYKKQRLCNNCFESIAVGDAA